MTRTMRNTALLLVVAAMLVTAGTASWAMRNENPGIIPNVALPHGTSYGEWGAQWWEWALSTTLAESPVLDTTGEFCGVNQSGKVFLLAGTFGTAETRDCEVPAGHMFFFPIVNVAVWNPEDCADVEACTALAGDFMDAVDILEAEIDGVPIPNPAQYRAVSEPFVLEINEGTIFTELGYEPGPRDPTVAEGFYIMLAPLSVGHHTIHFRGGISSIGFESEVTYNLTVRGGRSSATVLDR